MKKKSTLLAFYALLFISTAGIAQSQKLRVSQESTMTISGTSTLHDWTSRVDTIRGYVEVNKKMADRSIAKKSDKIHTVHIEIPVKSIISPRGATMDKKTWNALKSDTHPLIIFDMDESKISDVQGAAFSVNASGTLTIAGKTNSATFPVKGKIIAPGKMQFEGSYKLNMRDFDIEPPSAMFGQIVTGENVEIKFDLIVSK